MATFLSHNSDFFPSNASYKVIIVRCLWIFLRIGHYNYYKKSHCEM